MQEQADILQQVRKYINDHPEGYRQIAKRMGIGVATLARMLRGELPGRIILIKLRRFFEGLQ